MNDLNEKIEAVQTWINEVQQNRTTDPVSVNATEAVLSEILHLIQQGTDRIS